MEQPDSSPSAFTPRVYDDGRVLFVNTVHGTVQEEHPITRQKFHTTEHLPFGWERVVTEEGKVLFVNHLQQTTTYEDPRLRNCAVASGDAPNMPLELRQIFDANSTADQVLNGVDLRGKTFLVTGGTSGVGAATVRALAKHGGHVVFTGRNVSVASEMTRNLQYECPSAQVDFVPLDLCSLDSVRYFAEKLINKQLSLDCLILNAGVFGTPYELTSDGFESMFQVNVLAQLYLLILLKPLLVQSAPSRVVFVSSESHRSANVSASSISQAVLSPSAQSYSAWTQYNNTKLYQILLADYLHSIWAKDGISFFSLHPGNLILTGLSRSWWVWKMVFAAVKPFTKSVDQGAATTVLCATAENLQGEGGKYWNNCWLCDPSSLAQDVQLQKTLWQLCRDMLGDRISADKMGL